ncbi:MAG: nucleotidyltransferase domain-containing protein [Oscillospiraceae bacterium]|nr:nucleotidyltransferase domain-containing protein [Oscillospiraceae bacterium]
MESGVYKIEEIISRLEPVFSENRVRSAVLFGSYAKNAASGKSDIDLIVDSGLRGLDFVGLIEHIREALNKDVDVIDIGYIKKDSRVYKEMQETGVRIYG